MLNIEHPYTLSVESLTNPNFDRGLRDWTRKLFKVERYSGLDMIHRPNLLIHSMRVKSLSQGLGVVLDRAGTQDLALDFDHFKVVTLADQHDVAEIVTGDILAPDKRRMSSKQRKSLMQKEITASLEICRQYFTPVTDETINRYLALQLEVQGKNTIESRIVNVADKWDALGEKLHEIACGNFEFIPLVENSREVFEDFKQYDFWKYIGGDSRLMLNDIPSSVELQYLSRIDRTKIDDDNFENSVQSQIKDWPICYRSWLELSFINFWKFSPQFIFPGWYPGLEQKLGLN